MLFIWKGKVKAFRKLLLLLPWRSSSVRQRLRQWQSGKLNSSVKFLLNSDCETLGYLSSALSLALSVPLPLSLSVSSGNKAIQQYATLGLVLLHFKHTSPIPWTCAQAQTHKCKDTDRCAGDTHTRTHINTDSCLKATPVWKYASEAGNTLVN